MFNLHKEPSEKNSLEKRWSKPTTSSDKGFDELMGSVHSSCAAGSNAQIEYTGVSAYFDNTTPREIVGNGFVFDDTIVREITSYSSLLAFFI